MADDAYWNQMPSKFIQCIRQSSVAVNRMCKRFNANMQLLIQMCILAAFLSQLFLLHTAYVLSPMTISDDNNTRLMAIFQDSSGKAVHECFHSAFYWS